MSNTKKKPKTTEKPEISLKYFSHLLSPLKGGLCGEDWRTGRQINGEIQRDAEIHNVLSTEFKINYSQTEKQYLCKKNCKCLDSASGGEREREGEEV